MSGWSASEAKQRFSEVVRRSAEEPQEIFKRNRLVAAVISAESFQEFERWREARRRRSLAGAFDEVRELAARYGYELEVPEREDRDSWPDERS